MSASRARARSARAALLAIAALATGAGVAHAQQPLRVRVTVPSQVALGERFLYRAQVIGPTGAVAWFPPENHPSLSWGTPRLGRTVGRVPNRRVGDAQRGPGAPLQQADTAWVEVPLQVFQLGLVPVPGMRFRHVPQRFAGGGVARPPISQAGGAWHRLPVVEVMVTPLIPPADTAADLREVRNLAAPWWERVPWRWVLLGGLLVGILAVVVIWLVRRRRRRDTTEQPAAPALSPAARALAELAALRKQGLPQQGRYAEHSFELGQTLRRYLEATVTTTRPGDSTPELVAHLRDAGLDAGDLQRLAGLLRVWDRVKFARETFTAEEAVRAEAAVESFVRRAPPADVARVA